MAPELRISLARESDVAGILAISNWAAEHTAANFATTPEPLDQWLETWKRTAAFHPWLVGQSPPGGLVGFAKSSPHKTRGAYASSAEVSVYIDEEFHGQGVGTALYAALIPLLRAQGYVTLLAGIVAGHEPSERLHAKVGFVRCGTFHRIGWKLDRWQDVGYWEMHLQHPTEGPPAIRPVAEVWHAIAPGARGLSSTAGV